MSKKLFVFVSLLVLATLVLTACGAVASPSEAQVACGDLGVKSYTKDGFECNSAAPEAPAVQPTQESVPTTAAQATLAPTQGAPAQPSNFLLAGSRFPAYANGQLSTSYDLYAEANGRLWQKWLPTTKVSHSVAFELPPGDYIFNGVVARLYLDVNRNGLGSSNPLTVGNGNDLKFTVKLPEGADYKTAWVLVESDGGTPAGFDIWFQGE